MATAEKMPKKNPLLSSRNPMGRF